MWLALRNVQKELGIGAVGFLTKQGHELRDFPALFPPVSTLASGDGVIWDGFPN